MFRLTREVRFAIDGEFRQQLNQRPLNGFGGFPAIAGLERYFALQVTLEGELNARSSYLRNIKDVDEVVRRRAIEIIAARIHQAPHQPNFDLPAVLYEKLESAWPGTRLAELKLMLSPQTAIACRGSERPMVRLSHKFEFSASHRLCNPKLSDAENRATFGKCSNPHGHGHNYELQVTLRGTPGASGLLIDIPKFEKVVHETVIEKLDHKNLNVEVAEFEHTIPSVENIARTIYHWLKQKLDTGKTKLVGVIVWETAKTWCEYSEE